MWDCIDWLTASHRDSYLTDEIQSELKLTVDRTFFMVRFRSLTVRSLITRPRRRYRNIVMSPRLPKRRQCRPIANELQITNEWTSSQWTATCNTALPAIIAIHSHLHSHSLQIQISQKSAALPAANTQSHRSPPAAT